MLATVNCLAGPTLAEGESVVAVITVGAETPPTTLTVTRAALVDRLLADAGASLLEKLIHERVVEQAAKKAGVTVKEEEIDEQLEQLKQNLPLTQTLEGMLADQGISLTTLREQIRMRLRLKALVSDQIDLDDAALRRYFDGQPWLFEEKERARVSHIWHRNEQKLRLLQIRIQRGVSFESVMEETAKRAAEKVAKAAEKGEPVTADQGGGEIGWIPRGAANVEAAFLDVAFRLKPGEVGGPVRTPSGYHLVKVIERQESRKPNFEEIKDRVRETVEAQELQKRMGECMGELLKNAKIERLLGRAAGN